MLIDLVISLNFRLSHLEEQCKTWLLVLSREFVMTKVEMNNGIYRQDFGERKRTVNRPENCGVGRLLVKEFL